MTLYDRAVELQLKLELAQSADAGLDLLGRAARMDEALGAAAAYFQAATELRGNLAIADRPNLDIKAVTQAVSAFRRGISQHSSSAFQHQPAANLVDTARAQRDRCARWVSAQWRQTFADVEPQLERVANERLSGRGNLSVVANARASKLRNLRGLDPVTDRDAISQALGTDDASAWRAAIDDVAAQLASALAAIDAEHAALTPEVRTAVERAGSAAGLPLDEVSVELLGALRAAGVDAQLIVRRQ